MKTKTINLYEYEELLPEAKEKALAHYREHNFEPFGLQVHLDNEIQTLLEQHGIKPISTADKKYDSKYAQIYYSLSSCQGDGVMFEGTFTWNGYTVNIKRAGRYYHSNSKCVEITDEEGNTVDTEEPYTAFEAIYQSICKELERQGYDYIEDMESEAYFIELCNDNGYTFREDGTMENN